MAVVAGEKLSVILITHDKLPRGKYLAEKEDGTGETVFSWLSTFPPALWCFQFLVVLLAIDDTPHHSN